MRKSEMFRYLILVALAALMAGCGREDDPDQTERATAVTVAWPELRAVERTEFAVGRLEAAVAPLVAAETPGRIERILRDAGGWVEAGELLAELDARNQQMAFDSAGAEIQRLDAVLENQQVQASRLRNLAERQSVAQDQLDAAETQIRVYRAQRDAALARLAQAELDLERTRIVSPVSGHVQTRRVSAGDFVATGQVLFEVVSPDALRAILPLPESLQDRIEIGQSVRLSIPARPGQSIDARVSDVRPMVGRSSRAVELMVDLDNPGGWRAGGSVRAELVLERHEGLVVPPAALVQRPAGTVVFVYDGGARVEQRLVEVGIRRADWVEIAAGLDKSEPVVVDGAGFLADQVRVDVQRWLDPLTDSTP